MKREIRVAIAGVGNCASALVQGVQYYRGLEGKNGEISGIISHDIGGYTVGDIRFVVAFDVSADKVDRDLSDALNSTHLCTRRVAEIPHLGAPVLVGALLDGLGDGAAAVVAVDERAHAAAGVTERVVSALRSTRADVLINFLPVGSRVGTEFYAGCAIEAGCAFINAIPVPVGREGKWRSAFESAGLPLLGDDIKSQVGATMVHRALVELFSSRGYELDVTYQLNVGGNMDFLNMMDRERLVDKKISKAQAILDVANRGRGIPDGSYHISPSDYIPFLGDRKIAFIRLEGRGFAKAPIDIELRMTVEDSPNSAGVVVEAIRYAKLALDRGLGGYLAPPSAWLMKAPAFPARDAEAKAATDAWVAETGARG